MEDLKLTEETKILVIPASVLGVAPYIAKVADIEKKLNVSIAQIANALKTGHVLKQHYFDWEI